METQREINSNYLPVDESSRTLSLPKKQKSRLYRLRIRGANFISKIRQSAVTFLRLLLLPSVIATAVAMIGYLKLCFLLKSPRRSSLHSNACDNVSSLTTQYPFHFYPILAKCFELAHLQSQLPSLLKRQKRVVEMAIGEGSFSRLIYPPGTEIVALELYPTYLQKASRMKHVREAIVCDCLRPPICDGSFDLLVSNNFLHHVTHKNELLSRWARISKQAIFNENTKFWASSWVTPFILRRLGLDTFAAKTSARIEDNHWQCLRTRKELDSVVADNYDIVQSVSYFNERTFFFCAVFSFFMICTGPPTPQLLKWIFLGPLRSIAIPMTEVIAKLLIQYDDLQDRSKDVFVSYTANSRMWVPSSEKSYLSCPECHNALDSQNRCTGCALAYDNIDRMLFLLPRELDHVRLNYSPLAAATASAELL